MKTLAGTLVLGGIVSLIAACEYTPHDTPEDLARSHDRVLETLTHDIETTGPDPVYSTSHRAADSFSTQEAAADLSCDEVRMEVDQFARALTRHKDLGQWDDDEAHFSFSFEGCDF